VADNLIDFLPSRTPNVARILGWPTGCMQEIEEALVNLGRGAIVGDAAMAKLGELGLVSHGALTQLGSMASYNSSEFAWQGNYDPLEGLVETPRLGAGAVVLDLGCGSGQTIRRLFPQSEGTVVGVDSDIDILAYGSKLFSAYGLAGLFCRASAHALPFPANSFDFIVCRGVISYTRQRVALREAMRVLRPGSLMFLRVESQVWDLLALAHPTGVLRFLFNLRSLAIGLFHDLTGLQPMPGGALKGPRAYVSRRRFRRMVSEVGGEILRYESSARGPQFLRRGTQDVVLCRKRG
jgi:SAM-dependent methyltransferase